MICLTVCVFFVNTDVPQLKGFASDPQVQESCTAPEINPTLK